MVRSFSLGLAAFAAFLLVGCATASVPQRFKTGVALPRIAAFDASGQRDEDHHKGAFTVSTSHSSAYDDAGKSQGSNVFAFGGEFAPTPAIAFGLRPYGGDPMGSETGVSWGFETWFRWRPLATSSFHLTLEPSFRYSRKKAIEEFCVDAGGVFSTSCVRHIDGYAEVEVSEPGLSVFLEFYSGKKNNSFALVPAVYHTKVHTENHLEGFTGDYELDANQWNYSGMLYYLLRFGKGAKCLFQMGAGAAFTKEFNQGGSGKRDVEPLVDFGFTIGF